MPPSRSPPKNRARTATGGHVVAFWSYVEPGGELNPREAGRALREIHEALADYADELPDLHTHLS